MSTPSHSRFQGLTLDVGGTLIEPWPSVGQIYAEAAIRNGATNVSAEILKRRLVAAWAGRPKFNHNRAEWADLVDETFQGITEHPPSRTFFPELYERFGRASAWRVFDDVLPLLDRAATRGIKLGVISNWDELLRPLLAELKLADYFEAIVVSCEVGFSKPSRVIFETAAEKLALPPAALLHIGDNEARDFLGARKAGFQAIRLQRNGANKTEGQISSLSQIDLAMNAESSNALHEP